MSVVAPLYSTARSAGPEICASLPLNMISPPMGANFAWVTYRLECDPRHNHLLVSAPIMLAREKERWLALGPAAAFRADHVRTPLGIIIDFHSARGTPSGAGP